MARMLGRSVGATLLLAGLAVPVLTQEPGSVWVEPRLGWSFAHGELGRTDILQAAGSLRFDDIENGPALGVGAGVTLTSTLALRGSVEISRDVDATVVWSCAPFVACPSVVLTVEGQVARWAAGVDAIVDPGVVVATVRPRIVVGAGVRHYTMTWDDPIVAAFDVPVHRFEGTEPALRLGLELASRAGHGEIFASFEATGGRFGGERAHFVEGAVPDGRKTRVDLGLFAGVRWPLR